MAEDIPVLPVCTCCPIHAEQAIRNMRRLFHTLDTALETLTPKPPHDDLVTIGDASGTSGKPYVVHNLGRKHNRIMVAAAVTVTFVDLENMQYTLQAGWNPLDLPEGCKILGPNPGVLMRFQATDYTIY